MSVNGKGKAASIQPKEWFMKNGKIVSKPLLEEQNKGKAASSVIKPQFRQLMGLR
jgi:hypothetical protein